MNRRTRMIALTVPVCFGGLVGCQKDTELRTYIADSLRPYIRAVAQGTCNLERNLLPQNPSDPNFATTNKPADPPHYLNDHTWRFCEPQGPGDNYTDPPKPPK
jgi:hypothetical protein